MNEKLQGLVQQTLQEKGKTLLYEPEKWIQKIIIDKDLKAYLLTKSIYAQ
ncbi:MAG: hypothetical protein U0T77_03510 [Chitinophagales bacterium]